MEPQSLTHTTSGSPGYAKFSDPHLDMSFPSAPGPGSTPKCTQNHPCLSPHRPRTYHVVLEVSIMVHAFLFSLPAFDHPPIARSQTLPKGLRATGKTLLTPCVMWHCLNRFQMGTLASGETPIAPRDYTDLFPCPRDFSGSASVWKESPGRDRQGRHWACGIFILLVS